MKKWSQLFEGFDSPSYFDGMLYHATSEENVESILRDGVKPTSYWAIGAISEYYVEVMDDESGGEGVVLEAHLSEFDLSLLEADFPGIEEPITTVIRKSGDQVYAEWEQCEGTWQDSLRIIGSVRYRGIIKPRRSEEY